MKFKKWLESEFEKNYELNGEYWITDDGGVMYADGDIGDYNHEGYVIEYVQSEIADYFNVYVEVQFTGWDEIKNLIIQEILDSEDEKTREELQHMVDDGEEDEIILQKMQESDPNAQEKLSIANGHGDAREYAIIKWGWKRVAGNNIESRSLNSKDMWAIARGIGEIDETIADDAVFSISIYGGQHYDVTFAELEAGRLNSQEPETPQPNIPQDLEQNRRQQQKIIDIQQDVSDKQVRNNDIEQMHPYYQNKKFPLGDWNSFQTWMNRLNESTNFKLTKSQKLSIASSLTTSSLDAVINKMKNSLPPDIAIIGIEFAKSIYPLFIKKDGQRKDPLRIPKKVLSIINEI